MNWTILRISVQGDYSNKSATVIPSNSQNTPRAGQRALRRPAGTARDQGEYGNGYRERSVEGYGRVRYWIKVIDYGMWIWKGLR